MFNVAIMGYKTSPQHQQRFMDKNFKRIAWRTMACFVDDLIIFSDSYLQHLDNLDEVFGILENLGLTLKAKKCFLGFQSLELLGYLVDRLGLTTTEAKTEALKGLELPETLAQLEYFIGLTNWNRHLIPLYSQKCEALQAAKTKLLARGPISGQARRNHAAKTKIADHLDVSPGSPFHKAFHTLRDELAAKPGLYHFKPDRELYIFVEASKERGIGAAAYQMKDAETAYSKTGLVPIIFLSRTLTPAETRYWPTEHEFSGLVWAVKKLTTLIEQTHATIVTDHKPNVDIANMSSMATTSTARANLRLQTWANYLSRYAGRISLAYTRGRDMEVPDALSRMRSAVTAERERMQAIADRLKPGGPMSEFEVEHGMWGDGEEPAGEAEEIHGLMSKQAPLFWAHVRRAYSANRKVLGLVQALIANGSPDPDDPSLVRAEGSSFVLVQDREDAGARTLHYIDPRTGVRRLVVPTTSLQREILAMAHDDAAHQGLLRTYRRAAKGFYWRGMADSVKQYVAHCRPCLRNKN